MARAKGNAAENVEKGPSKMGLVRDALQQLGGDAKPKAIFDHLKDKHGVEIPPTMISSYKSTILGKGAERSTAGRGGRGGDGGVSLSDVEAVRQLVERVGPQQLEQLIKVLAK